MKVEEPTVTPTTTPVSTLTPIPVVRLEEGIYKVIFGGEETLKDVQVETCISPCDGKQVEEQLRYDPKIWKIVVDERVIYTHSGRFTNSFLDYELGEVLRKEYKNDSIVNSILCFGTQCYSIIEYKVPDTDETRVSSSEIFPQQEINDYIVVTCEEPRENNSRKLFILMRLIN